MKKRRTILLCALVTLVLLVGGLLFVAQQYLNSEGFQKQILSEMSQRLQCEIRLKQMKIRIHRGADLVDIRVASDRFHPRDFMKAERLRLRYDLFEALFHQKIVLEEFKFSTPEIEVNLNEPIQPATPSTPSGPIPKSTSLPGGSPPETTTTTSAPSIAPSKTSTAPRWPAPPSIDLRSFVVENGSLKILLPGRERLWIRNGQVRAAFTSDPVPSGTGAILCESVDLPPGIQLSRSKIDFLWRADSVTVPRYVADVLGGSIEGTFKVDQTSSEMPFVMETRLINLSAQDLLQLALASKAQPPPEQVMGVVKGEARFEGNLLQLKTAHGQGRLILEQGRLINFQALRILGGYLNHPELRDHPLQKCQLDFLIQSGRLQIPDFQIQSADLQLNGKGWIQFSDQSQEFEMKLRIGKRLLARVPEKDLEGLTRRTDESIEVSFRTWGSLAHLQTDLTERFERLSARAYGGAIFDKIFQVVPAKKDP